MRYSETNCHTEEMFMKKFTFLEIPLNRSHFADSIDTKHDMSAVTLTRFLPAFLFNGKIDIENYL